MLIGVAYCYNCHSNSKITNENNTEIINVGEENLTVEM